MNKSELSKYMSELGRKGAYAQQANGSNNFQIDPENARQAAKKGWTEERRKAQSERMKLNNPRKKEGL